MEEEYWTVPAGKLATRAEVPSGALEVLGKVPAVSGFRAPVTRKTGISAFHDHLDLCKGRKGREKGEEGRRTYKIELVWNLCKSSNRLFRSQ